MSATASWARSHKPEIAWGLFAAINFLVVFQLVDYETVPFHFVWVSLTLLYGFRVWGMLATLAVLAAVCVASTLSMGYVVAQGAQGIDELTEVPLMSAMFLAMVWHARRRKAAHEAVRRSAEREREFVRDASHQLKTPIAIARGLADLAQDHDASARQRSQDMIDLTEELTRLGDLAEDLLLLASAEQPGSLVIQPVDVEDLIVDATRRWSRTAARDWRVVVDVDGVIPGDRQRLDSALDAVLENALHATTSGDIVGLSARASGTDVILEVRDTGTGIPLEHLPRVFDRFTSVNGHSGRRGTGLGLPIAKAIAEGHGGSVVMRSQVGRGTVVTFRLPGLDSASEDGSRELRGAA
jgi:signal transduction histidine kinase